VEASGPFFGESVLRLPATGGRAFLHHDRDFGILTDDALVVLGLGKTVRYYRRSGKAVDVFQAVGAAPDQDLRQLERRAIAVFQTASELYENRRFALPGDLEGSLLAKRGGGRPPLGRPGAGG